MGPLGPSFEGTPPGHRADDPQGLGAHDPGGAAVPEEGRFVEFPGVARGSGQAQAPFKGNGHPRPQDAPILAAGKIGEQLLREGLAADAVGLDEDLLAAEILFQRRDDATFYGRSGKILIYQEVFGRIDAEEAAAMKDRKDTDIEDEDQEEGAAEVGKRHILHTSEPP